VPSPITVTATQGGSTANGLGLRVYVLAGAATTQNGATAGNQFSSTGTWTQSITTTQTGSRVYGAAAVADIGHTAVTAAALTTVVDDVFDNTHDEQYVSFKATSVTGTPGATTLGFTGGSLDSGPLAMAEILTAGTLTEDGSAPPPVSTTTATQVTTASFTPPGNSLLVALVGSDGGGSVCTMTVGGGGVTWTELVSNNPANGDYAGVWVAQMPPPDPGDPVITATQGGSTANGIALAIKVLTGAAAVQNGATATKAFSTAANQAAITPNATGSIVYGAGVWSSNVALTINGSSTQIMGVGDGTNGETYGACRATATTTAATPVTVGWSAPTTSNDSLALLEVLAAGTLAEDASAPPVASTTTQTTVSCAGFTPPPGSLLVAMVSSDGGGAVTTMTVSGGGLAWSEVVKVNPSGGDYAGVWIALVPPAGAGTPLPWPPPAYRPGKLPGLPGGEPFVPWPQPGPSAVVTAAQDVLAAAATVTATAAASLDVAKAGWQFPPQYAPAWFPSAPSAPGGDPFTPWPLGQTGVNSAALTAALTVTAADAAALTESKPLTAASTITAAAAATETTSKPLSAAVTVTAAAAASLTVVKAGMTPVPEYPAAWFPSAPGVPGGQPFAPWPVWSGTGGTSVPQDLLTAAAVITASRAAALTESKPLTAAATVTAAITATLTTSKPLTAATTVTASRAAAETTAKPLNAAVTVTATAPASLSDVAGPGVPAAMAPLYAPAWFPGAPGLPGEAFAPWPPWTGALPAAVTALQRATGTVTVTGKTTTAAVTGPAAAAAVTDPRDTTPAVTGPAAVAAVTDPRDGSSSVS
jgi:hypothetical protein